MEDKYDLQLINYFGEWFNYKRFFFTYKYYVTFDVNIK